MLAMGFEKELNAICNADEEEEKEDSQENNSSSSPLPRLPSVLPVPARRQTLLFSATFAAPVRRAAEALLRPSFATVAVGAAASESLSGAAGAGGGLRAAAGGGARGRWGAVAGGVTSQRLVAVCAGGDRRHKLGALVHLIAPYAYPSSRTSPGAGLTPAATAVAADAAEAPVERTIVFCGLKRDAAWVARQLRGLKSFGGSGALQVVPKAASTEAMPEAVSTEALTEAEGQGAGKGIGMRPGVGGAGLARGPGLEAVRVVGGARCGRDVAELHGDLSQAQRDDSLSRFRSGKACVLVCTDGERKGCDQNIISYSAAPLLPCPPSTTPPSPPPLYLESLLSLIHIHA